MITLLVSHWEVVTTGYLDGFKRGKAQVTSRLNLNATMDKEYRNLAQLQLLLLEMERQLLIISAMIKRVRSRWGLPVPVIRQRKHRRYRFMPWLSRAECEEDGQYTRLMPRLQLDSKTKLHPVASTAVGPASGCETEDTGVRSRFGCTWQCGPYWCRFSVGTFAAACPYVQVSSLS